MKKEKLFNLVIECAAGVFAVTAVVFIILFCFAAGRKPIEYIVIDDSIYGQACQEKSQVNESVLKIIKKSDFDSLNSRPEHGKFPVAAAVVEKITIPLYENVPEDSNLVRWFAISSLSYVPAVSADFSDKTSVNDPLLSVTVCAADNIPEEYRALPVNGVYAGQENYAMDSISYAKCSVLAGKYSESIFSLTEELFGKKNVTSLEKETETVFLASVGDIMVARGPQDVLINDADGLSKVFGTTLPVLQNNDFTMGNLEGVVTESWSNATKTYTFKFHKQVLTYLKQAGFDYFMQTNNHCYDYGEAGFKDTLKALSEYDIPTSGAGLNAEEARKFYHTEIKGTKFAIISCGAYPVEQSGFNGQKTATATAERAGILWQDEKLLEDIRREKNEGNFVIVNVHGGEEYRFVPNAKQRALYESFIDSGADVVFGSHPHVLQPTEWHNGGLIVYSMGNFLFNGMDGMNGATESEIIRLGIRNGKILYTEIYPAKLSGGTVNLKGK